MVKLIEFLYRFSFDDWISATENLKRWFHFKLQALWHINAAWNARIAFHRVLNDKNYKPVGACEFIHLRLIKLLDSITFSISPLPFGGNFSSPKLLFAKLNDLIIYNPVGAVLAIKTYMSLPRKKRFINFGFKWPTGFSYPSFLLLFRYLTAGNKFENDSFECSVKVSAVL